MLETEKVERPSRRKRCDRRRRLTKVDRRTALYLRIVELRAVFDAEIGSEPTPLQRMRAEQCAQMLAVAEAARGKWMRAEAGMALNDVIRAERAALLAMRELGVAITPATQGADTGLSAYLDEAE